MSKNNITIHDIARELKISASTVSRALSGYPRISDTTRKAVMEMAERSGYQPNNIASNLRKGRSKTAGIIVPRINRVFFSTVIGGIEDILTPAGYSITICQSHELFNKELLNLNTLNNLRVDGVILSLATGTVSTDHIQYLINKGYSIVMFDRVAENLDLSYVKADDFQGSYLCVKHLIEQGYKNIAHFTGPEHLNVYRDRKAGYIQALKEHGLDVHEQYILKDCLSKEKGIEACRYLLSLGERPDAIFSSSDFSAIGAVIAAKGREIKVPDDLGIAGFANEPFTEIVSPSLTSVDQDAENMGKTVAKVFLRSLHTEHDRSEKEKITLTPKLIVRESSNRKITTSQV